MVSRCWRHVLCRDGAGVTDARREAIARRRLVAVTVTVASLAALIALVQGLGSHARGDRAVHVGYAPRSRGELRAGSDPSVLPGPVLIADRDNNRLLEVSPTGQVLWRFPEDRESGVSGAGVDLG